MFRRPDGFATSVLEELRAGFDADGDSLRVQLWPEHFDLAVQLGSEDFGARATYGLSPGDELHPEPYLYVTPWAPQPGELWQATQFQGAELSYAGLIAARDQRAAALEFFGTRGRAGRKRPGPSDLVQFVQESRRRSLKLDTLVQYNV